jgi:YbbR domain-containing protein
MAARPAVFRNLGLKIVALLIALMVWFVLSAERRERISERSYRIALSVVNIPSGTIIASPVPGAVDIRVRGPFTALRQVDPEKLEAVIDLHGSSKGERMYRLAPEDINITPDIEVIAISPGEVRIVLDSVTEKILPIVANVTGTPAPGFEVADVGVEPRTARVSGPSGALAKMSSVTTDPISVGDRASSFSLPATVLADVAGVRVREGQVVTVSVRIVPAASPTPSPAPTAPPSRARGR